MHGSRTEIVESSIKFTELWQKFQVLKLHANVRSDDQQFSTWLLEVGDAKSNNYVLPDDVIEIPAHMICTGSIVTEIFGEKLLAVDTPRSRYSLEWQFCARKMQT